jgi:3-hydroxyisobutyrate dehydrogenase-like beta-hydroxyacid dehydrogenase
MAKHLIKGGDTLKVFDINEKALKNLVAQGVTKVD